VIQFRWRSFWSFWWISLHSLDTVHLYRNFSWVVIWCRLPVPIQERQRVKQHLAWRLWHQDQSPALTQRLSRTLSTKDSSCSGDASLDSSIGAATQASPALLAAMRKPIWLGIKRRADWDLGRSWLITCFAHCRSSRSQAVHRMHTIHFPSTFSGVNI
jgi:hypothetical protein